MAHRHKVKMPLDTPYRYWVILSLILLTISIVLGAVTFTVWRTKQNAPYIQSLYFYCDLNKNTNCYDWAEQTLLTQRATVIQCYQSLVPSECYDKSLR